MASRAPRNGPIRDARSCYDHLAGRLGVAVTGLLVERGWVLTSDAGWSVGPNAEPRASEALGVEVVMDRTSRRAEARPCPDWTERTPHLAGRFGAAVLDSLLAARWVERVPGSRILSLTTLGRSRLVELGVDPAALDPAA